MPTCSNCNPCTMQQPSARRRFVLTPLADGSGWLWHVVPGQAGWKPWGEAPTRESAIEAAEKYVNGGAKL